MMSTSAMLSSVVMLAAFSLVPATAAEDHAGHLKQCAKVCADCQLVCDACYAHCLDLLGDGKKEHAKTARMCADCAECCKTCATLCARQSPLAGPMLECCRACCAQCAAACERFPDDKHMSQCAQTCRQCAKECKSALDMIDK